MVVTPEGLATTDTSGAVKSISYSWVVELVLPTLSSPVTVRSHILSPLSRQSSPTPTLMVIGGSKGSVPIHPYNTGKIYENVMRPLLFISYAQVFNP